jgi:hypothetical protein
VTPIFESDLKSPQYTILRENGKHHGDGEPRGRYSRFSGHEQPSMPLGYREEKGD